MRNTWVLSIVLVGLLLAAYPIRAARSFEDFPHLGRLDRATLSNPEGDRLDVIHYRNLEKLPALVIIPGSLCAPIFASIGDASESKVFATVPLFPETERTALGSHIVFLERRNIVSLETMSSAPEFTIEQIFKLSPCSERNGGLTLDQRVDDALVQISWLKEQSWVASIHLIGISEGSDVAAGVAASDGSLVSSLMLVGGAGPSQFSDFAAFARSSDNIDDVRTVFSELDQFLSDSSPAMYKGYDARRWQSFAIKNSALDLLAKSNVPLFIAHGDRDENVPISSADLAAIEVMRKQPNRPVFYWSVVGGNHMLKTPNKSRIGDIVAEYLAWATSNPSGRTFRAD